MPRMLMLLDEISYKQAKLFVEAICFSTTDTFSHGQNERFHRIFKLLDSRLCRPNLVFRIVTGGQTKHTRLCLAHRPLNATPVHALFALLRAEVGRPMKSLVRASRDGVGAHLWDSTILNLRTLHDLWLIKQDAPNSSLLSRLGQKSKRCEACMMAQISINPDMLLNLWSLARSRMSAGEFVSKKRKTPRSVRWIKIFVDLCIRNFVKNGQQSVVDRLVGKGEETVDALAVLRRTIRNRKRAGELTHKLKVMLHDAGGHQGAESCALKQEENHNQRRHPAKRLATTYAILPADLSVEPLSVATDGREVQPEQRPTHDLHNALINTYVNLINTPFQRSIVTDQYQQGRMLSEECFQHSNFLPHRPPTDQTAANDPVQRARDRISEDHTPSSQYKKAAALSHSEWYAGSLAEPGGAERLINHGRLLSQENQSMFSTRKSSKSEWTDITIRSSHASAAVRSHQRVT